jgi:hypothetical protein
LKHHGIRFANRAAREVRRLVQVRQRRVVRQLRPKRLDHLLAVQPMITRQRKHLYQLRATTMLPGLLRNKTAVPQHLKPTQQAHLKAVHQHMIFSSNDDARKSATMNSPDDAVCVFPTDPLSRIARPKAVPDRTSTEASKHSDQQKAPISGAFQVRPRGLEPPRTIQSTRPSTL